MIIFITIKKKIMLEECPFCKGNELEDVSNSEYPNMFECLKCGKITQIKCDLKEGELPYMEEV